MKKENKNVVVVSCPPCGENALEGQKGVLNKKISFTTPLPRYAVLPPQGGQRTAHGFTLIELLVVVLIIGILAAVAVPQYQKTIERSRAVEAMTLVKSVAQAAKSYYLENGVAATSFDQLTITVPWKKRTGVIGSERDTIGNEEWALAVENSSIICTRLKGKYKGAFFGVRITPGEREGSLVCSERIKGSKIIFDSSLPKGAYCERVMQATRIGEDEWNRHYKLP